MIAFVLDLDSNSMVHSIYQQTLQTSVTCSGIGLHSGKKVQLALHPASSGSGITFVRTDVAPQISAIQARHDRVTQTRLGTTIANAQGVSVSTIEHLMAALWGAGIDNARVELDGPEVPIMDGSAEPFLFLIECAGIKAQTTPRHVLKMLKPVKVADGDSTARLEPARHFSMNLEIDFDGTIIDHQHCEFDSNNNTFKLALSRARTFGFAHEVEHLRAAGLAQGGSLDNAIVVGENGVLNEGGLRYADEFVRHKALDCVGDLFLAGGFIRGRLIAYRPGHAINNQLLRAVFADKKNYEWMALKEGTEARVANAEFRVQELRA